MKKFLKILIMGLIVIIPLMIGFIVATTIVK